MDVFVFYSKSKHALPGKGANEELVANDPYATLSKMLHWRRVLSMFFACDFYLDGILFSSAEHAFHYSKLKCVGQHDKAEWFYKEGATCSALEAKVKGGKNKRCALYIMTPTERQLWDEQRSAKLLDILRAKFEQSPMAKQVLLATRNAKLRHFVGRGGGIVDQPELEQIRAELLT